MRAGFLHSRVGIPAPRHLSRTMTAITIPRQYDNFTDNFFPPESLGTNASCSSTETAKTALAYVSKILCPLYVWNFTDQTS